MSEQQLSTIFKYQISIQGSQPNKLQQRQPNEADIRHVRLVGLRMGTEIAFFAFATSNPAMPLIKTHPYEIQTRRSCSLTCSNPLQLCAETSSRQISTPNIPSFNQQVALDAENSALRKLMTRRWQQGDVYAPHDLSAAETRKWAKKNAPSSDPFDKLNINPLSLYKVGGVRCGRGPIQVGLTLLQNFTVMSEFMTSGGRIKHSKRTGLRPVNQRKIAKAIRRAIALGLMPSTHQHPQYLIRTARSNVINGSLDNLRTPYNPRG